MREQFIRVVHVGRRRLARFLLMDLGIASRRWLEGLTLEMVLRKSDSEIRENVDQVWTALHGGI